MSSCRFNYTPSTFPQESRLISASTKESSTFYLAVANVLPVAFAYSRYRIHLMRFQHPHKSFLSLLYGSDMI